MKEKLKIVRGSGNVFIDLGFDKVEASNLKLRSDLMIQIMKQYNESGMTLAAAAKKFGLSQVRLNALLKGKIGQFDIDDLVAVAIQAGLKIRLVVREPA